MDHKVVDHGAVASRVHDLGERYGAFGGTMIPVRDRVELAHCFDPVFPSSFETVELFEIELLRRCDLMNRGLPELVSHCYHAGYDISDMARLFVLDSTKSIVVSPGHIRCIGQKMAEKGWDMSGKWNTRKGVKGSVMACKLLQTNKPNRHLDSGSLSYIIRERVQRNLDAKTKLCE